MNGRHWREPFLNNPGYRGKDGLEDSRRVESAENNADENVQATGTVVTAEVFGVR